MAKTFEKKCLQCVHAMRDPNATPDQVISRQVAHLCTEVPPTTAPVMTGRGVAFVTSYPMVTSDTISCSRFASETGVCLECGGIDGKHYGHCSKAFPSGFRGLSVGNNQKGG